MRFWGIDAGRDRAALQRARSQPPGLATTDRRRRRMFGAALEQFDELLDAAAAVGPAVSPIPLYYAMTQAGRALAAARVDAADWRGSGHGISARASSQTLGETSLEPHSSSSNQFAVFCRAIDSPTLAGQTTLGAAWAAIPQLEPTEGLGEGELPALVLHGRGSEASGFLSASIAGELVEDLPREREAATAELRRRLSDYPTADVDRLFVVEPDSAVRVAPGRVVEVEWRSEDGTLRALDLVGSGLGPDNSGRYLWPGLGGQKRVLKPLALWWLVLLGLSSVARYEPDRWLRALDRDRSVMAIPIEEGLSITSEMLPWLLVDALRAPL